MTAFSPAPGLATGPAPDRRWPLSRPFRAPAWCAVPDGVDLDVAGLATTDGNRWSGPGEPTIYLAGDPGLALAERGRHWAAQQTEADFWCVRVDLAAAVDLRHDATRTWLGLPDDIDWVLDPHTCRAVARLLRASSRYDGLIVPSVAFLDDATRWNAVVFLEHVRPSISEVIRPEGKALRLARLQDDELK